jgi:hypothetical protein
MEIREKGIAVTLHSISKLQITIQGSKQRNIFIFYFVENREYKYFITDNYFILRAAWNCALI